MSDEEDYMSDKFLLGCVDNDIRPGLIKSYADKRGFENLKRKRELDEINRKKNPSIRLMESEKRKEGLEKPIEKDNKGFAMLQKMGYKPGSSIGNSVQGRTEPVPITIKANREGLGTSQAKKELYELKIKEIRKNTVSTSEYRSRMTEKVVQKQTEGDFRKSQRMCERLDSSNGVTEPVEKWYWFTTDPDNEDKKEVQLIRAEKRRKFYDDDSEPEVEYMDPDQSVTNLNSDTEESGDEEYASINLGVTEKLWDITTYLRNRYMYCIWCSVQYNDEDDLGKSCPGRTRELH